jgi:hypothetical protein
LYSFDFIAGQLDQTYPYQDARVTRRKPVVQLEMQPDLAPAMI